MRFAIYREREREKEKERQTDRQTETDRQTGQRLADTRLLWNTWNLAGSRSAETPGQQQTLFCGQGQETF